jgi:hypothetical protein
MATFDVARDMRSAAQVSKREKEHLSKWARGTRPAAGCKYPDIELGMSESHLGSKVRPQRAYDT